MRRYHSLILALVLLLITAGVGYYLYSRERQRQDALRNQSRETLDAEVSVLARGSSPDLPIKLFIYQPGKLDPNQDFLVAEERPIFHTEDTVLKARQIINELLKSRPLFPDGAKLRQVFLLSDGTAVVDLSKQTVDDLSGGVTSEMAAILSITRSLRANLGEIERVRFLVDGQETETFGGHVSIREPFM
jgi:spore germination protein GerM